MVMALEETLRLFFSIVQHTNTTGSVDELAGACRGETMVSGLAVDTMDIVQEEVVERGLEVDGGASGRFMDRRLPRLWWYWYLPFHIFDKESPPFLPYYC